MSETQLSSMIKEGELREIFELRPPQLISNHSDHSINQLLDQAGEDSLGSTLNSNRTCTECRKSKVKCDRSDPCSRCLRLHLDCVPQKRGRGRPVVSRDEPDSTSKSDPVSNSQPAVSSTSTETTFSTNTRNESTVTDIASKEFSCKRKHLSSNLMKKVPSNIHDLNPSQFTPYIQTNSTVNPNINGMQSKEDHSVEPFVSQRHKRTYQNGNHPSFLPSLSGNQWRGIQLPSDSNFPPFYMNSVPPSGLVPANISCPQRMQEKYSMLQDSVNWPEYHAVKSASFAWNSIDIIIESFRSMCFSNDLCKPKALVTIRHWMQVALEKKCNHLMNKTLQIAQILGFKYDEMLDDLQLLNQFNDIAARSSSQDTPASRPPESSLPDFIKKISYQNDAVCQGLIIRGRSKLFFNDIWKKLFISEDETDKATNENILDIWGSIIHVHDRIDFFSGIANLMFRNPNLQSECSYVLYCVDCNGAPFPAHIRLRCCFSEDGHVAAYGLSVSILPKSRHIQSISVTPQLLPEAIPVGGLPPLHAKDVMNGSHMFPKAPKPNMPATEEFSTNPRNMNFNQLKTSPQEYRQYDQSGNVNHVVKMETAVENGNAEQLLSYQYMYPMPFDRERLNAMNNADMSRNMASHAAILTAPVENTFSSVTPYTAARAFSQFNGSGNELDESVILNDVFGIPNGDHSSLSLIRTGELDEDIRGLTFDRMMRDAT